MKLNFQDLNILLIGDFMVDHYLFGSTDRFSPEAPIPVVNFENELIVPGGAGNVAMNLTSFGVNVTCVGCVGDDLWGKKLIKILKENKINTKYIEIKNEYQTTCKQRVYCASKQQSRLDFEVFLSDWSPAKMIDYSNYDLIILSDYNKGVFKRNWFSPGDVNVILDPKIYNSHIFKYSNIITPNIKELGDITNTKIVDISSIENVSRKLIDEFNINYVVVTKGEEGMTIISDNEPIKNIKAHKVNNPDVTGAGDTVIAALGSVYAKTGDIEKAAEIANAAAALAVQNRGTFKINVNKIKDLVKIIDK